MKNPDHELLLQRTSAFMKFNEWEQHHRFIMDFQTALDGLETILNLLPEQSKARPFDPSGIAHLHKALSQLQ